MSPHIVHQYAFHLLRQMISLPHCLAEFGPVLIKASPYVIVARRDCPVKNLVHFKKCMLSIEEVVLAERTETDSNS